MKSDWSDGMGWLREKKKYVAINMLNGSIERGITYDQYSFNGKQWNPYLEVEIIQCKEALFNNFN